jgi:hypothetical protein
LTSYNGAFTATATASARFTGTRITPTGFPYHHLNLKVELLVNTTWTDITSYVLVRDNLVSTYGRTDETTTATPMQLTLTLRNADGRFTPENTSGAYYPYVQLNTQLRLSVNDYSVTGVAYSGYRFWGEVSEWPPEWDVTGHDVYCQITASGILRRISQANSVSTIGSPYTRFNNRLASNYTLAAYWPMEDGSGSTSFASNVSGQANMVIVGGTPSLGSCGNFRGSDAIPTLNRAELSGTISTNSNPTNMIWRFCLFPPSGGEGSTVSGPLARLHLTGTLSGVDVSLGTDAEAPITITGYNSSGTDLFSGSITGVTTWGVPMLVQVGLTPSGSNIYWSLNIVEQLSTGYYGSVSGQIPGNVDDATSVIFNPGGNYSGTAVGQTVVLYSNAPIGDAVAPLGGYQEETADARFARICAEEGIGCEIIGTGTGLPQGPQVDDTLMNVFQDIEYSDGGQIYETLDQFGLGYRTMASLQNQSSAMTLDYAAHQVGQPMAAAADDALIRNDITLVNYDGYTVEVFLENGAASVQPPPNGVGNGYTYSQNTFIAFNRHDAVNALAIQLLNCGTTVALRYPNITTQLANPASAPLFNKGPSMRIGDYLTVVNVPSFGGPSTQKQLVWGWTENFNQYVWNIVYNTIPEAPWESSYNPGVSATQQIPGTPVTQGTAGTVTGAMIAEGAIIGANLAQAAVGGSNIADGTIQANNIAQATILGTNIANGVITGTNIGSATITGSNIAAATITGGPSGNIASATITGTQIANGTITGGPGGNIASASITGANIGVGTITGGSGGNIASASITGTNIVAASITGGVGGNLANGTITALNIGTAQITASQISGTAGITGSQLSSTANIQGGQIGSLQITNAQIANGTITNSQINANAGITGTQLAASTITNIQISNNTITYQQISPTAGILGSQLSSSAGITAGQVAFTASSIGGIGATISSTAPSSPHTNDLWFDSSNGNELKQWNGSTWVAYQYGTNAIAASSVTASLIAANAVIAGKIAANAVTAGTIAANAVVAGTIAANAVTTTQIAANTILASNIQAGIVLAGAVNGTTITGANFVADGTGGQMLLYSGTAGGGNLIGSWSSSGGTDSYGNTYPAGLYVGQGVISGLDIDSTTITNTTFEGGVVDQASITTPQITGGSMTETQVTFDSTGGQLLVYTSVTTNVTQATGGTYSWVVPATTTSVQVQCYGAGAGGNGGSTGTGGSGGGGGAWAANWNYPVTPGETIYYTVGAGGAGNSTGNGNGDDGGDSFFDSESGVVADGGYGNGGGGFVTSPQDVVSENGGNGGNGSSSGGAGGGGGSAGSQGPGGNAANASSSTGSAGGAAGASGGAAGGTGGSNGGNGSNGSAPGAGGGGAGKGTSTGGVLTKTYSPNWVGSYYGPDATNGTPNGLRTAVQLYQGGETASGGTVNGTQRSIMQFPYATVTSDFSGYTITDAVLVITNEHSYYSSGMTVALSYGATRVGNGQLGTFPTGLTINQIGNGTTGEGETHHFGLGTGFGAGIAAGSMDSVILGASLYASNPLDAHFYGYFNPNVQLIITGTKTTAGTFHGGNGADGKVFFTYTSGQTLVAAISPAAGTDEYGNSYVTGGSFQNLELYGAPNPAAPTATNAAILYSTGAGPNIITKSGYRAGISLSQGNSTDAPRTANSGSATAVTASFTIPANDAVAGTCYRLRAWGYGTYSSGSTNWWQTEAFGSGPQGEANFSSLPSVFQWESTADVIIVTTGSSGTAHFKTAVVLGNGANPAAAVGVNGNTTGGYGAVSVNTTVSTTMAIYCAVNGTCSITGIASTFERI